MHYAPGLDKCPLPFSPFKSCTVPRPIGWISTVSEDGIYNLAPYSYFNAIADRPHFVMFSSVDIKDSVRNIEETGEFTVSLATEDLFDHMNGSSAPADSDIDEFELAGLKPQIGKFVSAPFVSEASAALECKHWKTIDLPNVDRDNGTGNYVIFGQVVGIFINDKFIKDGLFNARAARPLVRLGYMDYGVVGSENTFTKNRPRLGKDGKLQPVEEWDGIYR